MRMDAIRADALVPPAANDESPLARRVLSGLRAWRSQAGRDRSSLAGTRVLVVDDYRLYREAAAEALTPAGGKVVFAGNGWEALDELRDSQFDAVLMDLHMPLMDGYTAIARIREQPRHRHLPVLAWSNDTGASHREYCLRIGANGLLAKAIEPSVLRQILAGYLPARNLSFASC